MSARSKAWVCRRSLAGISGSNPSSSSSGVLQTVVCLTARDGEPSIMIRLWPNRGCCAMWLKIRREVNVLETVVMTNRGMLTSVTIKITSKLECDSQTYSFETLLD